MVDPVEERLDLPEVIVRGAGLRDAVEVGAEIGKAFRSFCEDTDL